MPFLLVLVVLCCGLNCMASLVYLLLFRRKNRPNYAFQPGEYCVKKMQNCPCRQEFYYIAGNSTLKGYYYPSTTQKLVVIVHGFRSGADDFLPLTRALVNKGFCVFAFDATGTYDSKGRSLVGMCQSLVDLDNTLKFIQTTPLSKHQLYLVGHSLGGYAVLSVLQLHNNVKGCVALAPVCDATKIFVQKACQYIGAIATIYQPTFDVIQRITFGKYVHCNSIKGINSTNIPVLIVQGAMDKVVPPNTISVTAYMSQITNPNVCFCQVEGVFGEHSNVWHSREAVEYKNTVEKYVKNIKNRTMRKSPKLSSYYQKVDDALYSQVDNNLVEKIVETFSKAI